MPALLPSVDDFPALLDRARAGCRDAAGRLLEAFRPLLLTVAHRAVPGDLRPKVAASDVVQETLVAAHGGLGQFRGAATGELRAWLLGILAHRAADLAGRFRDTARRDMARERPLGDPTPLVSRDPSPSAAAVRAEAGRALDAALARLPDDQRQAILLRHRDRLPFAEVGARLGRTEEAARQLWARAVRRLQREVGPGHGRP